MIFFKKKNKTKQATSPNGVKTGANLMSQVISLPVVFIILLLGSGIYGQFLGKKISASLTDVYLKVISPLVNYQAITSGLDSITINLVSLRSLKPSDPSYATNLAEIKKHIDEIGPIIEQEKEDAKGRPYEEIIGLWVPEWQKFHNDLNSNMSNHEYLKNNIPRLVKDITNLGESMEIIDSIIKNTIGDILDEVDIFMSGATKFLTIIQVIGLILGILITFPIVRNIKRLFKVIDDSKKSMETLLNNLDQGFMIYSSDGVISPGASKGASVLFGRDPVGLKLAEVLEADTPEEQNRIESWLKILFSGKLPFYESKQWGPRSFEKHDDRYVELEYRPILKTNLETEEEELEAVICIASDKTQERILKKNAEREQARLNFIANVAMGRELFVGFLKESRANLSACKAEIENTDPNINLLFRLIHNIKGNTNAFKMVEISSFAHTLESILAHIRDGSKSLGECRAQLEKDIFALDNSFEAYILENKDFIGDIDTIEKKLILANDIYQFENEIKLKHGVDSDMYRSFMSHFVLEDLSIGFTRFEKVVGDVADKLGKNVKFSLNQAGIKVCLVEYSSLLSDMVHLFRNAVDHGIEDGYLRDETDKPMQATIEVFFKEIIKNNGKFVQIMVRDDGGGINAEIIRKKCIEKGLLKEEEASQIDNERMIQFVFNAGFSTQEIVSEISGRGVGLDSVRHQAEALNGSVWVTTELGKWTQFFIEVPIIEKFK